MKKINISLNIGMIYQCNMNQDFGIIVSLYGDKLYYFEKELNCSIPKYDLVSYLKDPLDCTKATNVIGISNFKDSYSLYKEEMETYEGPLMERPSFICSFVTKENNVKVHYTAIPDAVTKRVLILYTKSVHHQQIPHLTVEELEEEIRVLKQFVNNFDEEKVIKTYSVTQSGWYQRRVGRDDFFITETEKSVQSDDIYIRSLLPVGRDCTYEHYGYEDENYHYVDEEKTLAGQHEALSKYSKERHFSFLLHDFLDKFYSKRDIMIEEASTYEWLFNLYKVKALTKARTFEEYNYKQLVCKFDKGEVLFWD